MGHTPTGLGSGAGSSFGGFFLDARIGSAFAHRAHPASALLMRRFRPHRSPGGSRGTVGHRRLGRVLCPTTASWFCMMMGVRACLGHETPREARARRARLADRDSPTGLSQVARVALLSDKVELVAYNDPFIHGEVRGFGSGNWGSLIIGVIGCLVEGPGSRVRGPELSGRGIRSWPRGRPATHLFITLDFLSCICAQAKTII